MGKNKQLRREQNRKVQNETHLATLVGHQRKLEVLSDQIAKISAKIAASQRASKVCGISLSILQDDDGDKYYSQFGRCFVQRPVGMIRDELTETKNFTEASLPKLTSTLEQFEKLCREQICAIQELKQQTNRSTS